MITPLFAIATLIDTTGARFCSNYIFARGGNLPVRCGVASDVQVIEHHVNNHAGN